MLVSQRSPSYPAEQWQLNNRQKIHDYRYYYKQTSQVNGIPETPFFQYFASSTVTAWIAVTSVNGGFAQLSVIAGSAKAFVVSFARRPASSAVLARESVARIAFSQHLVGYFT